MVVKELVTKFKFEVDNSGLNKFNNSIKSFKDSIVSTTGDLTRAIFKTGEFLLDLSKSALVTRDIAEAAGLASEEFIAMRLAAQQAGVSSTSFSTAISKIATQLKDASQGFGALNDLMSTNPDKFRRPIFGEEGENLKRFLEDFFNAINEIENRTEKIRLVEKIFGGTKEEVANFLRLIDLGSENFSLAVARNFQDVGKVQEAEESAKELNVQLGIMSAEFDKLSISLGKTLVPIVNATVKSINTVLEAGATIKKFLPGSFVDPIEFGSQDVQTQRKAELKDFVSSLSENFQANRFPQGEVNTNITVNIDVPQGTSESLAEDISEATQQKIQEVVDLNIRNLLSSNPQVE